MNFFVTILILIFCEYFYEKGIVYYTGFFNYRMIMDSHRLDVFFLPKNQHIYANLVLEIKNHF